MTDEISRGDKICFICDNVNSMRKDHRVEVGRMIRWNDTVGSNKLSNKGGGCQIRIQNLPDSLINTLYMYIKQKNTCIQPISPTK